MELVAGADPGNQYTVPWAYGTTGLGYNVTKVQQILGKNVPLDNWDILFKPENISKLKACGVSVLDAPDQMFAAALHYIGKDPMSTNPADYRAALAMLKKIRPYITQFNSSGYINDLVGGDVCFAYGWSGDVVIAKHRAVEAKKAYKIEYYIPKGGAPVWFDVMAIPKDAKNKEAALEWINYIETPQVHAAITNEVYYPSANLEARKYVSKDVAERSGRVPAARRDQDAVPAQAVAAGNPAFANAALDGTEVRALILIPELPVRLPGCIRQSIKREAPGSPGALFVAGDFAGGGASSKE